MKWIVMTLAVALLSGSMIGCEDTTSTTPTTTPPPVPTTDETDMPTTGPATQPAAAAALSAAANQYCAVMSEHKADPAVTVAHAGKTIGFCCADCIPTFHEEPAKYLASLK